MGSLERKPFDRLIAKEWLGWLPMIAVVSLLIGAFAVVNLGSGVEKRVEGLVQGADWRFNEDTGQHYPHIEVKLESGKLVRVGSLATSLPAIGERISVRQRPLLFEYLKTYEWDGPVTAAEASVATPPAPTPVSLP